MAQRLRAIPTTYHGIEFRSKLEAKYAQAFDRLGIVWEYEGHGFRFDDGTCYCPDFYMPEIDTYFEVKGVLDEESRRKVDLLAGEKKNIVVGKPDGCVEANLAGMWDMGWGDYSQVAKCAQCGQWHFINELDSFSCPVCGYDDGDNTNCEWHDNVFEAAGWERGR